MLSNFEPENISDDDLKEALSLIANECFPAMNLANALAGEQSSPWKIIRSVEARDLIKEAQTRGIDVHGIKGNVDGQLLSKSRFAQLLPKRFTYNDYLTSTTNKAEAIEMNASM